MNTTTISIDTQHGDMIHDVQLDYYGKLLATCSSDHSIRVYNIDNNASDLLVDIAEHSGPVWRVCWSHPKFGSLLASCSYDGTVKIFNISKDKSYSTVYTYSGHKASVNGICWAPYEYGLCLTSVSTDGDMSIIYRIGDNDWNSRQIPICRMGCNAVSWCPYRPAAQEGVFIMRVAIAAGDSCIHVLKCLNSPSNNWELEMKLRGHTDRVKDVAWCPFIGIPTNIIASCGRDRQLRIWSQKMGDSWSCCFSNMYSDSVWRVSWSITGNLLAVSFGVDNVDMWKEMLDGSWKLVNKKEETN